MYVNIYLTDYYQIEKQGGLLMGKIINCEKCGESIDYSEDLVTATVILEVLPFHSQCYATNLKGANTLVVSNQPLNGFASNFRTIAFSLFSILWAIFAVQSLKCFSFVEMTLLIYQYYSLVIYDRLNYVLN